MAQHLVHVVHRHHFHLPLDLHEPYFQRMFNPMTQQERFDPGGEYVRRWVPELRNVPEQHIVRPWRMSVDEQTASGCRIGDDYPAPVVDHAEERRIAVERYRAAAGSDE